MSLTHVRPYFRERALSLGWAEWKEPFNVNNIPATIIDNAFNVEMGRLSGLKQNQEDIETELPVIVRYFRKGYRDPQGALDLSIAAVDSYIREALRHNLRLVGVGLKNVRLVGTNWVRFNESNDNLIMAEMEFTTLVILAVDS